jgi:serine phosphatase RsbU (regulator of sigma subunit)
MDRVSSQLLSWVLLPVSAMLVVAALTLPHEPWTGFVLRGDVIAHVERTSPAARAGLAVGDRLLPWPPGGRVTSRIAARAEPGKPFAVLRERAGRLEEVTFTPGPLPLGERRMRAALLAVASGFVVLAGWVWSERRDRLTRVLFLAFLAFAVLIAPWPRLPHPTLLAFHEMVYNGVQLFLPALFIHLFALFPGSQPPSPRVRQLMRIGYATATLLFAGSVLVQLLARDPAGGANELIGSIAGVWFAAGLLAALVLFARSYARERSTDARRRLRVALVGTLLGVGPLAALVLLHNLFPTAPLAGDRWAVLATLLVPASFAWATVVHRVFAFRVALRGALVLGVIAIGSAAVWAIGEWLAAVWRADLGAGIAGGALAFVALTATVAGPASRWARSVGRRVLGVEELSPEEWMARHPADWKGEAPRIVDRASRAIMASLRLDRCAAVVPEGDDARVVATLGAAAVPTLSLGFVSAAALAPGVHAVEDSPIAPDDRAALAAAGFRWVLPIGALEPRAVVLLGRRLSGPWLGTTEVRDLERFAGHVDVLLENAALLRAAREHGHIDRELSRAGVIQAGLLPRDLPSYRTLDCAAAALSSEAVGGDYYDFVRGPHRVLSLAVGDAAGKGVPAALMGVWAQAGFRSRANDDVRPGQILAALNRELLALERPDAFVALLCARIEVRLARFAFANAGLTPPLVRRASGRFEELTQSGVLLGVSEKARYEDTTVQLRPGDCVVLYTDGLSEARRGEEMFGVERLRELLDRHADLPAAGIVRELLQGVRAFADQPPDDMTVVVLKQLARVGRLRPSRLQNALKWKPVPTDTHG